MRKPINVFIILISVLILTGCDNKPDNMLSGYSHGEFVYLSYSGNEKIERILINKGDNVAAGQELVKIESFDAQNIFLRAEENYQQRALYYEIWNLENGLKSWILYVRRLKSTIGRIEVKRQLGRYRNLYANHAISLAEWEDIRDELTQKGAQVEELINQLKARQLLPGRMRLASSAQWWPRQNSNGIRRCGMSSKRRLFLRSMLKSSILFIVPGSALLLVNQ